MKTNEEGYKRSFKAQTDEEYEYQWKYQVKEGQHAKVLETKQDTVSLQFMDGQVLQVPNESVKELSAIIEKDGYDALHDYYKTTHPELIYDAVDLADPDLLQL